MIDGAVHVLLIALRDIQPGEVLMFDYNGLDNMYPTDHFISPVCSNLVGFYSPDSFPFLIYYRSIIPSFSFCDREGRYFHLISVFFLCC